MSGIHVVRPLMLFLLSVVGFTESIQNCAVWKEIAPCTCKIEFSLTTINCERMGSFDEIVDILKNRFAPKDKISLRITSSNLYDLAERSFDEFNMNIESLKLNHDNLSELRAYSFTGLLNVNYLSLSDNSIPIMPKEIFANMPKVKTLDIGRIKLTSLPEDSFKSMPQLENLVLPGNLLSHVDAKSIPSTVRQLHIGRDMIKDLNGTLRELSELKWLFINANELTTLDGQLPKHGEKLRMIHASNNRIDRLPQDFKSLVNLESLFFQHNLVTRLDGTLSKSRKLQRAQFEHNRLNMLAEDDFTEAEKLESLLLGNNHLTALNGSVLPLRRLRVLNLTHNWFKEFSLEEVRGLPELKAIDLSHNRIAKIIGMAPNLVEWETRLTHLELDHNEITSLNGSLSGLRNLLRLNLSHNKLTRILPDDLIGLDQLTMLDVSHNQLQTLEETSKTFLPALEELIAHHNQLTILDRDFHGLPVLCWADLSNNQIVALGRDLVSKTHCKVHGIHEDTWGTLKIYLQDNPILCDAALPEITSAFEINHTRIAGVSHCAPLSQQPTTVKPNAYLGYIPENKLEGLQTNPMYNQLNYRQPQTTGYNLQENSAEQRQGNNERYYNANLKPNNIELQRDPEQLSVQNANLDNNKLTHAPLPYQNQNNLLNLPISTNVQPQPKLLRSTKLDELIDENLEDEQQQSPQPAEQEQPLARGALFAGVDPVAQEQELNQLATKIEELKTRVEELRTQNQRLASQILPLHQQQPHLHHQQQQEESNRDTNNNATLTYT